MALSWSPVWPPSPAATLGRTGREGADLGLDRPAAGHLYVMNQQGTTIAFKPDPEKLSVVVLNALGESTNATPAIADGEIFLRTHERLYCVADLAE